MGRSDADHLKAELSGPATRKFDALGLRQALAVGGAETPSPIGQETPVEWSGQYPPGFLSGYVFAEALRAVFAPIEVAFAP